MPALDVTDVLFDPDIAGETFTVVRRQEIVNSAGVSTITETRYDDVAGSIQPTGDQSLTRAEAFSHQSDSLRVITTFLLRGVSQDMSGNNFQPDLVLWKGDYYIVTSVDDYSQYGAGFVQADCIAFNYMTQAPFPPT
jgi:hypothetical protein